MSMLLRLADSAAGQKEGELVQQDALTAVILGVTLVEAFTNTYFRVVASELGDPTAAKEILRDLQRKWSDTRGKLRKWTNLAFGTEIDTADERWTKYDELVKRRNQFIHFKSTHETVSIQSAGLPVFIHGLTSLHAFDSLDRGVPGECVRTAIGIVELVGKCQGFSDDANGKFVHQWLSIPSGWDLSSL